MMLFRCWFRLRFGGDRLPAPVHAQFEFPQVGQGPLCLGGCGVEVMILMILMTILFYQVGIQAEVLP